MTSDPIRLLEDPAATSALRSDLVHATQVQLHGLDLAAGLAALQSTTATVTSSTTAIAGTSLLAKLCMGAGVTVGVVALWLGLRAPTPAPDEGERVAAPGLVTSSQPEPEPEIRRAGLEPRTVPSAGAESFGAKAMAEPAGSVVAVEGSDAEGSVVAIEASDAAADPKPASSSVSRRDVRPPKAAPDRPAASSIDTVLREAKLVAKARSNLARDPARALSLAEEAEAEFPHGQLVEERRAIAIRALVALGRVDEATRRAEPFLAEYGRGAHAAAVRRALEGEPEDP